MTNEVFKFLSFFSVLTLTFTSNVLFFYLVCFHIKLNILGTTILYDLLLSDLVSDCSAEDDCGVSNRNIHIAFVKIK